jgi:hypothetical protein
MLGPEVSSSMRGSTCLEHQQHDDEFRRQRRKSPLWRLVCRGREYPEPPWHHQSSMNSVQFERWGAFDAPCGQECIVCEHTLPTCISSLFLGDIHVPQIGESCDRMDRWILAKSFDIAQVIVDWFPNEEAEKHSKGCSENFCCKHLCESDPDLALKGRAT